MASNWTLVSDFSQTGSNFGKPTSVWDIGGSALVKTVLWKKGGSLPLSEKCGATRGKTMVKTLQTCAQVGWAQVHTSKIALRCLNEMLGPVSWAGGPLPPGRPIHLVSAPSAVTCGISEVQGLQEDSQESFSADDSDCKGRPCSLITRACEWTLMCNL